MREMTTPRRTMFPLNVGATLMLRRRAKRRQRDRATRSGGGVEAIARPAVPGGDTGKGGRSVPDGVQPAGDDPR
jgi:hypothetical protein